MVHEQQALVAPPLTSNWMARTTGSLISSNRKLPMQRSLSGFRWRTKNKLRCRSPKLSAGRRIQIQWQWQTTTVKKWRSHKQTNSWTLWASLSQHSRTCRIKISSWSLTEFSKLMAAKSNKNFRKACRISLLLARTPNQRSKSRITKGPRKILRIHSLATSWQVESL